MALNPTDPAECFSTSPFGFGPFPDPNDPNSVVVCQPHATGAGFGGVGYGLYDGAHGGTGYGLASYGATSFPAPPMAVSGGYGGDPYGLAGYGSTEADPPRASSAVSLNGFEIEVFFSEEMDPDDPALVDPASYTLEPVTGAAPSTVEQVTIETLGSVNVSTPDTFGGVTSVILRHTGTTLGGTYRVRIQGPTDISGNGILDTAISLLTKGEPPPFIIQPQAGGRDLLVTFQYPMLPVADYPGGALTTIESTDSYEFTHTPDYPIGIMPQTVTFPYGGDNAQVLLKVLGQTSLTYTGNISPSQAIAYDGSVDPLTIPGGQIGTAGSFPTVYSVTPSSGKLLINTDGVGSVVVGFQDQTAKLVAGSTFRADVIFEPGTFAKPVASVRIHTVSVDDGVEDLELWFGWDGVGGTPFISFRSGGVTLNTRTDLDWTTAGPHTVSLVRNQKAGISTWLWNGTPIYSTLNANLGAPAAPFGGVQFSVNEAEAIPRIENCALDDILITASSTVFSAAWNFLHNQQAQFAGNTDATRSTLKTRRGPLVKSWGDSTPATKQDVTLFVDDTEVEVSEVNPYLGEVTAEIPIPLLPPTDPQADVKVDYQWMASPVMELAGLNTPGLVLNKYDMTRGHHDPGAHGEQIQVPPGASYLADPGVPKGAPDTSRFPFGVVLGPVGDRRQPLRIGHRYMGFERDYSALLNSPTTLLLNQHPSRPAVPGMEHAPEGVSAAFEGLGVPTVASPAWALAGTDAGHVDVNQGTYTVIDDQAGSKATVYHRGVDLNFPSSVFLVGRFEVPSGTALHDDGTGVRVTDGVFTGVGFGVHDQRHVFLAGALLVNGVEHVGLLLDARRPEVVESWTIGPRTQLVIENRTTIRAVTAEIPVAIAAGDRFQILPPETQAGVYTISHIVHQTDGTTTLTIDAEVPADPVLFGNKYPYAIFEMKWSGQPSTYRLEVDPTQQVAVLQVSGARTATIASIDGDAATFADIGELGLLIPNSGYGGMTFWGSLSERATNRATWSFFRYGVVPDITTLRGHQLSVSTEMNEVPEHDLNHEWTLTGDFGFSKVDATGDALLLQKTTGSSLLGLSFAYQRIEPFLVPDTRVDMTGRFRVESGSGLRDAVLQFANTQRRALVSNLLYVEGAPSGAWRQLLNLPAVSMTGMLDPAEQEAGWKTNAGHALMIEHRGLRMEATQGAGQGGRWTAEMNRSDLVVAFDEGGRVIDARLAVFAHTANASGDTGIRFGGDVGLAPFQRHVGMTLRSGATKGVRIYDGANTVVQEYNFDWDDQEPHNFRLVCDEAAGAVLVYADDGLLGSLDITLFGGGSTEGTLALFGQLGAAQNGASDSAITSTVEWYSVSHQAMAPTAAKRTLGVWRPPAGVVSDETNLDQWELPRTDSTVAVNSAQVGPLIQEMDWREDVEVRVLLDPTWGVTVFRPDLALPPYYQVEDATPGTGFITETTEPSAGWINVEYSQLPSVEATDPITRFGWVGWGCDRAQNVCQTRWQRVYFRLFRHWDEDVRQPQNMVLNQYNVITSGERTEDVTLENVSIETLDNRRLTLLPIHMFADRIYKVIDGSTILTQESWTWDRDAQLLTLGEGDNGQELTFSSNHATVTVLFVPGTPVTNTYLLNQPLLDSITLLHEGTPPVPKGQTASSTKVVSAGGQLNSPQDVLNNDPDFILNDPYKFLTFEDDSSMIYEDLSFFTVEEGEAGLIQYPCEATELDNLFSGFSSAEGEAVYSPAGGGADLGGVGASAGHRDTGTKVGRAVGGHVLDTYGTRYWEHANKPPQPDWQQKGGMPGGILFASGGGFVGPRVDANGNIIANDQPLGGTLGPGTAVLYPTFPAGPSIKPGAGRIYKRTEWFMRLNSVIVDTNGNVTQALSEVLTGMASDNIPSSQPAGWHENQDGPAGNGGLGAAFSLMQLAGDYSRFGPWGATRKVASGGRWGTLAPVPDEGSVEFLGAVADGTTFTVELSGGASVVFTARAVPVGPEEFALAPQPHVNLANAINAHAVASTLVEATAGAHPASGNPRLVVQALAVVSDSHLVGIATSDPATLRIYGTLPHAAAPGFQILSFGDKVLQSSLLAGGGVTLLNNVHAAVRGMVALGGSALPVGSQQTRYLQAS